MPTLTGFAPSITFVENTVNSTPQLLDADVDFTDVEGDFDGGVLTLSGLLAEDTVSVRNQGTAAGQIGLSGANVTWGGVTIGTLAGGVGGTLTITFNASATSEAIDALIQNLTYANSSDTPTASRDLLLNITDAAGNGLGAAGAPIFAVQTGASNPFNGLAVGMISRPAFADFDADGDLDVLVGDLDGALSYFENTGTAYAPVFVLRSGAASPFNGLSVASTSAPALADIDGDGDLDAVVGDYDGRLSFFENTGTDADPAFTARTGGANPFNAIDVSNRSTPTFGDLDGDGDLDLIVGDSNGLIAYFENTGSNLSPVFVERTGAASPFNGMDFGFNSHSILVDLDRDGDLDALFGAYGTPIYYFENTGTASAPVFVERTGAENLAANFPASSTFHLNALADLNGDGSLDLVMGQQSGGFTYLRNTSPPVITVAVTPEVDAPTLTEFQNSVTFSENTVNATPQLLDANVTFADSDGDFDGGVLSLAGLLAEDTVSVRNQGSGAGQIGLSGANVTYGGVIIGTLSGGVGATLTITFNASATSEAIDALIQNLTYANSSDTPTASRDLLLNITDAAGNDLGAAGAPTFTQQSGGANPFAAFVGAYQRAPTFVDMDGDGDMDAVIGQSYGTPLVYLENTGTDSAPAFTQRTGGDNPLQSVAFGGFFGRPVFVDLDNDGDQDAVIGTLFNEIFYYQNIGTAAAPFFAQMNGGANPFNGLTDDISLETLSFGDLDGDGDMDAVVGDRLGGLGYLENTGTAASPAFTQRTGAANPFNGLVIASQYSAPVLIDVDGDGDLDAVVGAGGIFGPAALHYFENTGTTANPAFVERTGADNPFSGVTGYNSVPAFADLDGDGDLDILVGTVDGLLNYFENTTRPGRTITVNITPEDDGPVITGTGAGEGLNGTSDAETILGLDGDDRLNGLGGDDVLDGGAGNDTLRGGTGDDEMRGGAGDDIYQVDSQGDLVIENINEGNDRILSTVSYVLAAGSEVERMSLADANAVTTLGLTGNEFGQRIDGDNGANTLDGGGGNDLLLGNQGDDVLYGRTGTDDIRGGAGNDILNGEEDNDILNGGSGNDQLIGGTGDDAMTGGTGNDTYYVDSQADTVNELDGEGDDRVIASVSYVLAAGVSVESMSTDNLAGVTAINLTGNDLAQEMDGNAGANILSGLGGDDEVNGQGGNDQLFGGLGDDDLTGGDGDDTLYGEDDDDTLSGGDGNDALVGGLGDDSMTGGLGDDAYYVDSQDDTIDELDGQGNDRVVASASYVLAAGQSIERIQIANTGGTAAIDITGNEFGQRIDGNDGANILDGGGGNDVINARAGNDTVHGGLGNDELRGNDGNDRLFGGADVDNLLGGSGNDEMDGGTGGDRMVGDIGNDTYHVDSAGDTIVEFSGEGNDRVFTSVDFNVGSVSIERLSAADQAGVDPLRLYGGADTVQIDGNAGDNLLSGALGGRSVTLNGRGGQDTLFGSAFNDILSGGTGDDYVTGGEGNDFIHGGSGIDVVAVSGTVDDYDIEQLDDDSYSIDGRDGSDTTFGVEYIYFERSGEWYLLSDIEGGPVDPPFGPPAFPDSGSGKSGDDAQILPGLADEASDLRSLPDLFDMTGPDMRTADEGLGLDPTSSGRSHDDGWLF